MTSPPEPSSTVRPVDIVPSGKKPHSSGPPLSPYSAFPAEQNMATTIPIPRMPPHQNPYSYRAGDRDRQSTSPTALTSARSPSSYSSSYRSHPYPRPGPSSSISASQQDSLPRIHLPRPGSGAALNLASPSASRSPTIGGGSHHERERERERGHDRERDGDGEREPREHPSVSGLQQHEPYWRLSGDKPHPPPHRSHSGTTGSGKSGISLPPLHSISRRSPSLPPPIPPSNGSANSMPPPSIESSSGSSTRPSPSAYHSHPLGPSYVPYGPGEPGQRMPSGNGLGHPHAHSRPPSREHDYRQAQSRNHGGLHQSQLPPQHYRIAVEREREWERERERAREELHDLQQRHHHPAHSHSTVPKPNQPSHAYDLSSPPLRALPPSSMPPVPYGAAYLDRVAAAGGMGRPRSQSTASGMSRPGGTHDGRDSDPTPGQSRRLAHLMSEQKRRESINTGFQALRVALPSSLPTDSKAIILRKAVAHITHLENILRGSGVAYPDSPSSNRAVESPSWADEREDESEEREVKWEEER
ncbi:hypothetical protein IAU60_005562 [Kwoniella sp. DSM 27419]